jgi:spermidine synthase
LSSDLETKQAELPDSGAQESRVSGETAIETVPSVKTAQIGPLFAYFVVFMGSACTLILEIVAGRLLAPFIGVSLYTWTSIIGVVLAGISLGNYAGGRVADRWGSIRTLALIVFAGGLTSILVLPLLELAADRSAFRLECSSGLGSLLGPLCTPHVAIMFKIVSLTTVIFFLPAFVLGMISPVVVRLTLSSLRTSGNTVGKIYAFSTFGSIVGTFLAGFFLIATFGTRMIVLGVGLVLVLIALITALLGLRLRRPLGESASGTASTAWVILSCSLLLAALLVTIDRKNALATTCNKETDYFCIRVYDQEHTPGRVLRTLVLDHLIHSYTALDDPTFYEYAYVKVYAELTDYVARSRPNFRTAFIGGGGYTLPRGIEVAYSEASIDVFEIDPGVTQIAYEMMGISPDTRIDSYNFDARLMFDQLQGGPKYDLVFGDAFNDLSVPYHLTTREFNQKVRNLLNDDGFYMINVIDKFQGGQFLPSFVRTMKLVFPHVYIMSSGTPWNSLSSFANTYVVVGTATPLDFDRLRQVRGQGFGGSQVTNVMPVEQMEEWLKYAPGVVLTDDYAPADNLLAPLFAERGL